MIRVLQEFGVPSGIVRVGDEVWVKGGGNTEP